MEAEWEAEQSPEPEPDLDAIIQGLEAGQQPRHGDPYDLERRREILDRVDTLAAALKAVTPAHGGTGHNRPPPDDDAPQVVVVDDVREASLAIRQEVEKPSPARWRSHARSHD